MWPKLYSDQDFIRRFCFSCSTTKVLNAGSSDVRYGGDCTNVDIQEKEGVDYVCDIHDLPFRDNHFDIVVCNAVLQYCENPFQVARQFFRVLKPGGWLYVDAPWMQPYCKDTPDKFRFSEDGLKTVFKDFEIIEVGPSIQSGSAIAYMAFHMADSLTSNKYINHALAEMARVVFFPIRYLKTLREQKTAGAFYLVGRKPIGE